MNSIVGWLALIVALVALFYERRRGHIRLQDLPEDERSVTAAAAIALGETRVRLKDRRLLLMFVAILAFGALDHWQLTSHDDTGKRSLAGQQAQLNTQQSTLREQQTTLQRLFNELARQQQVFEAKTHKNCLTLNGTIGKIDAYLDAQATTTAHRSDLAEPTKAQLIRNLTIFRPVEQDCT